jgi:Transposase Tn5 dimerisation domain/Transposase DNA-binding
MLSWTQTLPRGVFRDDRLRLRAISLLEGLMKEPGKSFGGVFGQDNPQAKSAYAFCENDRIDFSKIVAPALSSLGQAIGELESKTILCIQDSTEIDLSHLTSMTGLGEIGNPICRGLFLHCGLAATTDGIPLGLLSALTWVRDPADHGKTLDRVGKPFEAKESVKWWKTICIAENVVRRPGTLLHVGDREFDIFDVFARAEERGFRLLVRAAQDRKVIGGDSARLWDEAESWPVVDHRTIEIPRRPARKSQAARPARTAELSLRFGSVTLGQPKSSLGSVRMSVVLVREEVPTTGESVEWLLLTNDAIPDIDAAWLRVDWYRRRWLIEEFHACLKTTCRAEKRQFEDRAHYETFLALIILISCRLLYLRGMARFEPDAPAATLLESDELEVLRAHSQSNSKKPLPAILTMRHAIRLIAMMGGFLARKGDGEPGIKTISGGYSALRTMLVGYRLAKGLPQDPDPIAGLPLPIYLIKSMHTLGSSVPP